MPNRNGTGPEGKGARTGRGLGNCNPQESGNQDRFQRRGSAHRLGRARRNRWRQGRS
ncbi:MULTISPECIES: DUF5320 domain-containing protein [unclassified Saccharicrinis]|uniref:DUF5320 domain-containing protein n=1 Tax=unclassified Saccharicrinis TaxID=2646859 RepID=UPI003D349D17